MKFDATVLKNLVLTNDSINSTDCVTCIYNGRIWKEAQGSAFWIISTKNIVCQEKAI